MYVKKNTTVIYVRFHAILTFKLILYSNLTDLESVEESNLHTYNTLQSSDCDKLLCDYPFECAFFFKAQTIITIYVLWIYSKKNCIFVLIC